MTATVHHQSADGSYLPYELLAAHILAGGTMYASLQDLSDGRLLTVPAGSLIVGDLQGDADSGLSGPGSAVRGAA
jgi:hypothetical protein